MTAIQPTAPRNIALPHPDFESLVQVVEKTVAASSARVYRQTFNEQPRKHVIPLFSVTAARRARSRTS